MLFSTDMFQSQMKNIMHVSPLTRLRPSIDDKIVKTRSSDEVTSENKTIQSPPTPFPFEAANDCCFLQAARTAAEHCMDWMGRKIFIFPFLVGKTLERPFRAKSLD